jgi:hypothetical protein
MRDSPDNHFFLFFFLILIAEIVLDIIGLPLDEIFLPVEFIVDLLILLGQYQPSKGWIK